MPTIRSVSCAALKLPFNHGGPMPLFAGKPRSTIDSGLIRVELDNGLVGWGEAYAPDTVALRSFIDTRIAPLAQGKDPEDASLVPGLDRILHNMGRSGLVAHALSGLDIALWDLRGKLAGVPLHVLLGGAKRTFIPAYASLLQYYGDTELVKRNVERSLSAGYGEVKLHEKTLAAAGAARDVMGFGVPLMLDTNCAWTAEAAKTAVPEYERFDLLWIEEPIWPPEDIDALQALRECTSIPLAAGENASSRYELTRMTRLCVVDYLQPSAIKGGGVTALAELGALCAAGPVRLAPQSAFFGPGFLATLHVLACQPEATTVERLFCDLGFTPFGTAIPFRNGGFQLTDLPGLGADPEPELLAGPFVAN